jgi:hypothetical protein
MQISWQSNESVFVVVAGDLMFINLDANYASGRFLIWLEICIISRPETHTDACLHKHIGGISRREPREADDRN